MPLPVRGTTRRPSARPGSVPAGPHEDRLAAVDALLVLAARGRLDAVRLGTDPGELWGEAR
ncbi:hypothetical protein GCM10010300_49640 [Streptomyces olivaceoviridis]|nr:hypothetical protein GCM10010300_49640 [Streptomyces olivaceoviridis]